MKTLFISLVLSFCFFFAKSQVVYTSTVSEMYVYDKLKSEWYLHQKNSNVDIKIVVEDDFVTLFAKSPTMFKIYNNTKEPISTENLKGYRYTGKDLKRDVYVTIDVMRSEKSGVGFISIINKQDDYNLRYFIFSNE